ncbi:hypothetical protein LJC61_07200 [Ruminococcaceae bacterium OttesenSCG-928-A16]|nr:hypothetical protein [Ruminococcaceae bacterium OttesenSCG-928-A16]
MINGDSLRKVADAFLGKRQEPGAESAPGPRTPLHTMLAGVAALPQQAWVNYAFEKEPLAHRITPEEQQQLYAEAWRCGEQAAEQVAQKYGTRAPKKLVAGMQLKLAYSKKEMDGILPIFAHFMLPRNITIYSQYSQKAQECYEDEGKTCLGALNVENVLIAHEIFHFVEEEQKSSIYTQTKKVQIWKKPFTRFSSLAILSEIAGMAFAQKLLNLPFAPYVMDVLLLYALNIDAANVLYNSLVPAQPEIQNP